MIVLKVLVFCLVNWSLSFVSRSGKGGVVQVQNKDTNILYSTICSPFQQVSSLAGVGVRIHYLRVSHQD